MPMVGVMEMKMFKLNILISKTYTIQNKKWS